MTARTWAAIGVAGSLVVASSLRSWAFQEARPGDERAVWLREELGILEARRAAEEAEVRLAQARLEQARHAQAYADSMQRKGYTPASAANTAVIEVRDREAKLAQENLDLKEVDVRIARLKRGSQYLASEPAAEGDRDRRIRSLERLVAELQAEVKALQQQKPR